MKGKNDVPTNPNPDVEEIIETTETEEVIDVKAEEIPEDAPQEEPTDSKEECSDESTVIVAEESEKSEYDILDDIDDVEPVQLNKAAYEPKVSKDEDKEPLTKGEFKNFKAWSIFTVIIAAILLLWIGCIFADRWLMSKNQL